jgi:hypothetical protein
MKEEKASSGSKTGKYIYDKNAGKLVKVSDRASAKKKNAEPSSPSCGTGGCCCCG